MRTGLKTLTTALLFSSALVVHAQTPQQTQPQTYPAPKPSAAQPAERILTITGCLKEEKAAPDAAVPADDTFVLSSVKMGATSPASAIGLAPEYEVRGISDVEMQKHIGHTVEITGTIVPPAAGDSKQTEPLKRDLPGFQASSIKMTSGTCEVK